MTNSKILKTLFMLIGTISVGLGVLGIFLPLLPTTPFLLLAAYFYARSSRRLYEWLLGNKYFGTYIRNYREKKGIPIKTKIVSIILIILTISYSSIFAVHLWTVRIALCIIAAGVIIHLVSFPTLRN